MKTIFLFKSIYKNDEGHSKFTFEIDIEDKTISMNHISGKAPHVSDIIKAISLKSDFLLNLYKKRKYDFYVDAKRSSIGTTYLSLFYFTSFEKTSKLNGYKYSGKGIQEQSAYKMTINSTGKVEYIEKMWIGDMIEMILAGAQYFEKKETEKFYEIKLKEKEVISAFWYDEKHILERINNYLKEEI